MRSLLSDPSEPPPAERNLGASGVIQWNKIFQMFARGIAGDSVFDIMVEVTVSGRRTGRRAAAGTPIAGENLENGNGVVKRTGNAELKG